MAFKKMTPSTPPRRWSLVAFPGDGKSSFAAQMKKPILPIDVDARFSEVFALAGGEVLELSANLADNTDAQKIDELLQEQIAGSEIGTIVVDSVTGIIQRITRRNALAGGPGNANKSAIHAEKANTMALLGTSVSNCGTHTLWIWHYSSGKFNGQDKVTETVSEIERDRLRKHLNAELKIVFDKNDEKRRGVRILWARSGKGIGQIVWDSPENLKAETFWKGIPEKIEQVMYPKPETKPAGAPVNGSNGANGVRTQTANNGTTQTAAATSGAATTVTSAAAAPATGTATAGAGETNSEPHFNSPEEAIAWGARELQLNPEEVSTIYAAVKADAHPTRASDMWAAWTTEVQKRRAAALAARF